ncbi:unnamed protein product [Caenorhabditis brenneri]
MSKSSKSPNQAKSSSSIGSMCPPTARSPSMMTAEALTDPNAVPTALPNSVNTAIGATPSDLESLRQSGLSDTSAGSGRVSSNASTPLTAKAPTSPELIMNDLRRGSLFGRQGKVPQQYQPPPPSMTHPPSYTNVTFQHTNMATASQLSSVGQPLAFDQKSQKSGFSESTKTGIPMSAKSVPAAKSTAAAARSRLRSPGRRIEEIKKQEAKQKQLDEAAAAANKDSSSKKSMKKSKKSKKSGKLRFGGVHEDEGKSKKSMKLSKKSRKSLSKKGVKAPGDIDFPSPRSKSKKSQKVVKTSVYLPGVMDGNAPNKALKQDQPVKSQKSMKSSRKFNGIPGYHFPGAGKCTRSMDQVAPPTPKKATDQSHCVYDVAQLPAAQRRLPPTCVSGRAPPKSIFGNKKLIQSTHRRPKSVALPAPVGAAPVAPAPVVLPASTTPAQVSPQTGPTTNTKIVIFGKTADGKNTIQMTIDMQIVAGEALGGSDKPIQVIPQKILVAGKEVPLDGYSQRGSTPPQ